MAAYLQSNLSTVELDAALSFYSTTLGTKFTQHGIVSFYRDYGFPNADPLPSFSEAEVHTILEFSKTSAGEKLMRQQILRSGARRNEFQKPILSLLNECRR